MSVSHTDTYIPFLKKRECYSWWIITGDWLPRLRLIRYIMNLYLRLCFFHPRPLCLPHGCLWVVTAEADNTCTPALMSTLNTSSKQRSDCLWTLDIYDELIPFSDNALCMYESAHPGRDLIPHFNVSNCFLSSQMIRSILEKRCRVFFFIHISSSWNDQWEFDDNTAEAEQQQAILNRVA